MKETLKFEANTMSNYTPKNYFQYNLSEYQIQN